MIRKRGLPARLNITNPRSSEILLVSVTVPDDDELAADLANGIVDAYLREVVNKEKMDREKQSQKLEIACEAKRRTLSNGCADLGADRQFYEDVGSGRFVT